MALTVPDFSAVIGLRLKGMALEPKPDFTLVAKFATYELDLLYGVKADGSPDPGGPRTRLADAAHPRPCSRVFP